MKMQRYETYVLKRKTQWKRHYKLFIDKMEKPNIKAEPNEVNINNPGTKNLGAKQLFFRCDGQFSPEHKRMQTDGDNIRINALNKRIFQRGRMPHVSSRVR